MAKKQNATPLPDQLEQSESGKEMVDTSDASKGDGSEGAIAPEVSYPRGDLLEHAQQVFGVKTEVVLGALHGNDKAELTITEVKQAISEFLKRKVK